MRAGRFSLRAAAVVLFICFLFLLFLTKAELAAKGVRQGFSLCTQTLLPSLFPFLVLSELLIATQALTPNGNLLTKPLSAAFGLSHSGAVALLLGGICGLPVGAVASASMCERGEISREELCRLLLFANNPGAGFLIGTVGSAMFGSVRIGIALFVIVWLSAAATGLLWRIWQGKLPPFAALYQAQARSTFKVKDLTQSVTRGSSAALQICAFVLFFSCISACLTPILAAARLPAFYQTLILGMLEMTAGIYAAAALPATDAFRLAAFLSSFAGLSVCLQLFSATERYRPPFFFYIGTKLLQASIALLLAEGYLKLFCPVPSTAGVPPLAPLMHRGLALSAFLLLLALVVLLPWRSTFFAKRKKQ